MCNNRIDDFFPVRGLRYTGMPTTPAIDAYRQLEEHAKNQGWESAIAEAILSRVKGAIDVVDREPNLAGAIFVIRPGYGIEVDLASSNGSEERAGERSLLVTITDNTGRTVMSQQVSASRALAQAALLDFAPAPGT